MATQKLALTLALQADGMNALPDALGNQRTQMSRLDDIDANILAMQKEQTLRALSMCTDSSGVFLMELFFDKLIGNKDKQQKKIIQWISPHDPSQRYHEVAVKLRHPESGQWFFTCQPFKEWMASKGFKLWLHGIPGAEETVLSSLSNHRCLLKLQSFWKQQCSEKFGGQDALNSNTPEQLCDLIRDMSSCVDNINIIVDALDECGDGRSKVVEFLVQLATDEYNNIRVNLTLREEFDIECYLIDFKKVSVAADKSNLRLYVHAELTSRLKDESLIVISESLRQEIAHRLVNDAEGMFRWVVCQFDHLCGLTNDKAIREALQSLPPTLFETYERILDRANSKSGYIKRLLRRVLAWTVCSPYPLSTEELLEAIAINLNDKTPSQDSMAIEIHILKWCSSLFRSTGQPGETQIELAHFTVKEFLLVKVKPQSDDVCAEYRIFKEWHYSHLAKICLT
ncbi:uncharacterized protein EAE97_004590 [Botrytis byssoidea]|uniref:NACHT domain-containing protein n=1 Tax=Botrytis byssoidea TaxID=139641 RepID=A0A9P5LWA6_9HELO|nr:uncharacterized protein EAE97_004590 [Botrytis byssoidea]KAF7947341.1 hypothetical protein EAE97_004590 [Botrytis byssoidea]